MKNYMNRTKAINAARSASKSKANKINRVVVFTSLKTNQYYVAGGFYVHTLGINRSFNIGGKEKIAVYLHGERTE